MLEFLGFASIFCVSFFVCALIYKKLIKSSDEIIVEESAIAGVEDSWKGTRIRKVRDGYINRINIYEK